MGLRERMANRPSNRARNFWTLELLELRPEDRVLELGYGPGIAIERAQRVVTRGSVVGIDPSTTMQRQASARNQAGASSGRVRLLVGSAEALPEELRPFDKIWSANVVQFWRDPEAVFADLRGRLAGGGCVATTYQPRHRGARPEDADRMADRMAEWLHRAGYADVRTERLELRPLPAVCALGRRLQGGSATMSG